VLCLQLKDRRVSLDEVVVLQPAATASHPFLSARHRPELLLEAVRAAAVKPEAMLC
jgi:hypothetical protein